MNEQNNRRNGIAIMRSLIGLIKPLIPIMIFAILLGVLGYLCAISLTILAGFGLIHSSLMLAGSTMDAAVLEAFASHHFTRMATGMVLIAVLRGLLHYGEQYCNHYIAFKLLALIRGKVFGTLRILCPAKLEGKGKGNLISMITSDIELLEVFYAHTVFPIAIGILTSLLMVFFLRSQYPATGFVAFLGYLTVGAVIPLWNGKRGAGEGMEFRNSFGEFNSFLLDSLRGLDETIQYGMGKERMEELEIRSGQLAKKQKNLNRYEASQRSVTNLVILAFSIGVLLLMLFAFQKGNVDIQQVVLVTLGMMGSFGPVVALSNLSNNLTQTLASGERVLSLLEEEPEVMEVTGRDSVSFEGAKADQVTFVCLRR